RRRGAGARPGPVPRHVAGAAGRRCGSRSAHRLRGGGARVTGRRDLGSGCSRTGRLGRAGAVGTPVDRAREPRHAPSGRSGRLIGARVPVVGPSCRAIRRRHEPPTNEVAESVEKRTDSATSFRARARARARAQLRFGLGLAFGCGARLAFELTSGARGRTLAQVRHQPNLQLADVGAAWDPDPSAGEWIAPLLGPFGQRLDHAVPRGYERYAVVPVPEWDDPDANPLSWLETLLDVLEPITGDQPVHVGYWDGWGWMY